MLKARERWNCIIQMKQLIMKRILRDSIRERRKLRPRSVKERKNFTRINQFFDSRVIQFKFLIIFYCVRSQEDICSRSVRVKSSDLGINPLSLPPSCSYQVAICDGWMLADFGMLCSKAEFFL